MKAKISKKVEKTSDEDSSESMSETENDTKQLLEPLDNDSSSEDDDVDVKNQQLKLDNTTGTKDKSGKTDKKDTATETPKKPKSNPESTIFVGNLPTNTKLKALKQYYSKFGEIISLRFRSETGKKVLNKSDRKKYGSLNAYVAFKDTESAQKATSTNGEKFKENHIRCNLVVDKQEKFAQNLNTKSTVFCGNITFEANDEELYDFFESKCGAIEYVRRIPKKGIAFVCFKPGVPLIRALKLNGEEFQGRALRIQKWESKEHIEKKEKRLNKKMAGKAKSPGKPKKGQKLLDTSRPSNNPLLKKIKEKTKKDDTVSKSEHKQKYRKGAGNDVKRDTDMSKKKSEFFGLRTDRIKKAKAVKKKQLKNKELKKIVKALTGAPKKT